ncbi:hypothetical protein [Deinococcus aluminii]|uniref:hypothetical protein n=1 Tax=Deinococcus aluminii TaxID=1656885 RepID=UPI0031E838D0
MNGIYPELLVVLTRITDSEGYPYFVEAKITDTYGKAWIFVDKMPVFTSRDKLVFPCVGRPSCTIEEEANDPAMGKIFLISTAKPYGVSTEAGESASFWILEEQLLYAGEAESKDSSVSFDALSAKSNFFSKEVTDDW